MREIVAGGYCGRKIDGLGSLLGLLVHPLGFLGRCCCLTILKKKVLMSHLCTRASLPRSKEMALAEVSPALRNEIKMLLEVPNETLS